MSSLCNCLPSYCNNSYLDFKVFNARNSIIPTDTLFYCNNSLGYKENKTRWTKNIINGLKYTADDIPYKQTMNNASFILTTLVDRRILILT